MHACLLPNLIQYVKLNKILFEKIHYFLWYGYTVYKIFNLRILLVLHYIWKSFKYLSAFRYVFLFQLVNVCFRNLYNMYLSVSVKGKMYFNALKCNFKKNAKSVAFPIIKWCCLLYVNLIYLSNVTCLYYADHVTSIWVSV